VADAVPEARAIVDYVTKCPGGRGAVREVCEIILAAQGRWGEVAARYEFA
jgi:3-deoxy-D-manno-octulosonate 8-phosphate phosphatase (KDO 8-P phosphatase)